MTRRSTLLLLGSACIAATESSSPNRYADAPASKDALSGPLSVDPLLDCGIRLLGWNFSQQMQPRFVDDEVFDGLRLGAECNYTLELKMVSSSSSSSYSSSSLHQQLRDEFVTPRIQGQGRDATSRIQRASTATATNSIWYADPINGNDGNSGSLQAPFLTVGRAIEAARGSSITINDNNNNNNNENQQVIMLRNGTFYLPGPIELNTADNGLTITSFQNETPILSAGVPLPGLIWSPYDTSVTMTGPFANLNILDDCVNTPGTSTPGVCLFNGTMSDATTCASNCQSNSTCTGYTWHDSNQGGYSLMCYFRVDGVWSPGGQSGHISGQKEALNIYKADLSALVQSGALSTLPFDTLYVNNRRAVRARYPNGNPELNQSPFGFMSAASWLAPTPPEFPPTNIEIGNPSRPEDVFFPTFQGGMGGTVSHFNPPFSFWGSTNPPAGAQFVVPSGLVYDSSTFSPRVSNWTTNPNEIIVHAFHGGLWGDWAFNLSDVNTSTNTLTFASGGWQEARGAGSGAGFYVENVLEEIDMAGEWYVDATTATLYYFFNGTSSPNPSTFTMIASNFSNVLTIAGSLDEPVKDITIENITFAHSSTTFMMPYEVPSGGDWSMYRGGMVKIEGTEGTSLLGCTFWSPGSNGLILSAYNRNATINECDFAYTGESAIVSAGRVNLIDGTDGDWPLNTLISFTRGREIGLYTKQSGFYYHALSVNATLIGNVFFNIARAGININDGFAGGHTIKSNLGFNTVRETADHGVFNSWDRQPIAHSTTPNASSLLPLPTTIDSNFFICNYHCSWSIDSDDGSNSYIETNNVIPWAGFKNYLGFNKHSINNLYIYPEASISMKKLVSPASKNKYYSFNSSGIEEEGEGSVGLSGAWPKCVMSYGTTTSSDVNFHDVFQNNTCIVESGANNIYDFNTCHAATPYDGNIPQLGGNIMYSSDGTWSLKCGGTTWTTLAQAQAVGVELGTTVVPSAPSTAQILSMVGAKLSL